MRPLNILLPAIRGTDLAGQTLTATRGLWDVWPSSFSFVWMDCGASGTPCATISGATGSTYTLKPSDAGYTVRVAVTAVRNGKSTTATSAATSQIQMPDPVNLIPPSISGTAQQGDTLTASPGQWTENPTTYTYQWEDCGGAACKPISSASSTSGSYTLQGSDVGSSVDVVVTASVQFDTPNSAAAAPTPVVMPAIPVDVSAPTIAGVAAQGNTLTASPGTWQNDPTAFTYTWEDCGPLGSCTPISGVDTASASYTLQASDVGDQVMVVVDASNMGGSALQPAPSSMTATVAPLTVPVPADVTAPSISGTAQVGDVLTASTGTWSNNPTGYTYTWEDCTGSACTPIAGAPATATYTVQPSDVGDQIAVAVTATNAGGTGAPAASSSTAAVLPAPPVNVSVPMVSGSDQQGSTLTTSNGTWSNGPTSFTYAWERCASGTCTAISGATSSSYVLTSNDVGDAIAAIVTATNSGGSSGPATSIPTADVLPLAPVNTAPPSIGGTAQQGATLTASAGTWSNGPTSFTYAWERCASGTCSPISGATAATYVATVSDVGDTLEVAVTAANLGGSSGPATSAPTGTVTAATPVNTVAPSISGTTQQGSTLTASNGTWSNGPTGFTYAWERCASGTCSAISGATASTYALTSADVGDTIKVAVTASNAGGAGAPAVSSATTVVLPLAPVNTVAPSISGTAQQGSTLTASNGTWSNGPTGFAYSWERCASGTCTAISGATASTYALTSADVGDTIKVAVTASNTGGTSSPATSAATATIQAAAASAPVNTTAPSIAGVVETGSTLTANTGVWSNVPTSYSYDWKYCSGSNCSNIPGVSSTANVYTVQASYASDTIEVIVTASNSAGSANSTSAAIGGCGGSAPCAAGSPTISGTAQEGSTLTASSGSWSGSPNVYTYQWYSCTTATDGCTPVSNLASAIANSTTYVVQPSDAGHTIEVWVTAANGSYSNASASAASATIPTGGPDNTSTPTISGTAVTGDTVTAAAAGWTGSLSYRWSDCLVDGGACTPIGGATSSTYTVAGTDQGYALEVTVTASNAEGSQSVSSALTGAVPVPPINIDVSIAGTATLGSTLTAFSHWSGSGLAYTYEWFDCNSSGGSCSTIVGAAGNTYTVAAGDEGHAIEVTVAAANAAGSQTATSAPTAVVQVPVSGSGAPVNTVAPSLTGTAAEGDTLVSTVGSWNGAPTGYSYQWSDCNTSGGSCRNVAVGGTSSTYVPTASDVGSTLEVTVTATNGSGSTSASSAASAVVGQVGSVPDGVTVVPSAAGSHLVDDAGASILPHGVDRSGSEYACVQFDAVSDGPYTAASVAAMAQWNINMVRIQLNEDCWLGINGVPANVSGSNYINAIVNYVNLLHQYGMYAYLSLMGAAPGSQEALTQPNDADEDHSPLYWQQIAATFKNDPNVIIAPYGETNVDWPCFVHGCGNEASYNSGPFDGDAVCGNGAWSCYYYNTAPMKQAIDVMRAAGFNGPISIICIDYGNTCSDPNTGAAWNGGTWLSEMDPSGNPANTIDPDNQLMAETHIYEGQMCSTTSCFNASLKPILNAGFPIVAGETGPVNDNNASPACSTFLSWYASNGMGWLSYTWDTWNTDGVLISNYNGTPYPGGYGACVQSTDQAQAG
jgi:hypothetical protein